MLSSEFPWYFTPLLLAVPDIEPSVLCILGTQTTTHCPRQQNLSASQQGYRADVLTSVDQRALEAILLKLWILKSKTKEGCQPLKFTLCWDLLISKFN